LKVLTVSAADGGSGAARAAWRTHRALVATGVDAWMLVHQRTSDDWRVLKTGRRPFPELRRRLAARVLQLQRSPSPGYRSLSIFPSGALKAIGRQQADVVHLHWVQEEMMSIFQIGRLRAPVVWTLHDCWAFCGTEHYPRDEPHPRWKLGYRRETRPGEDQGLDLDRSIWMLKHRYWRTPHTLICPSRWMLEQVRQSPLLGAWSSYHLPNPLDTSRFSPLDRAFCRQTLGVDPDAVVVTFGAVGGASDPRKGFDLLQAALHRFAASFSGRKLCGLVFGQSEPRQPPSLPFPTQWLGRVHDDATLALVYGASDVVVVPSRQENLPQVATEAQACGTPVAAFASTGLLDVIEHQRTGYLALAYDASDLAAGIGWILADGKRYRALSAGARERALALWAPEVVIPRLIQIYEDSIPPLSRKR
jgi:glycosyltransferase involved in cell wall biosynthesis